MFLIVGSCGQLGIELGKLLKERAVGVDIADLDITSEQSVKDFFTKAQGKFKAVINCAAYTAVDKAEDEEEKANLVNNIGVKNLARYGKNIIHISTDYVFDGLSYLPYKEEHTPNPQSSYGRTKLLGEKAVMANADNGIIIRTAWLYSKNGNNFVKTMMRLSETKDSIRVIYDQIGTPTYAKDLARAIVAILDSEKFNNALNSNESLKEIYHYTNEGVCSWYDFAWAIIESTNHSTEITPIRSEEYPSKVKRPYFSVLDKAKIKRDFNLEIPHWHDALMECLGELKDNSINNNH